MSSDLLVYTVSLTPTSRRRLAAATNAWTVITPQSISTTRDLTQSIETERRHAQEVEARDLIIVQNLELKLGIFNRWVPADDEWKQAVEMVGKRRYQKCLDSLEGLVVARMFELTKMNMSQTGTWLILFYLLSDKIQVISSVNTLEMPSRHDHRQYGPPCRTTTLPPKLSFLLELHYHGTTLWSTPSSPTSISSPTHALMSASRYGQNLPLEF